MGLYNENKYSEIYFQAQDWLICCFRFPKAVLENRQHDLSVHLCLLYDQNHTRLNTIQVMSSSVACVGSVLYP